ncbi:MAG: AAA family ATPase [Flavobacterium sp.]|nr:AAA family ATPase [Flavobacterium sp.]
MSFQKHNIKNIEIYDKTNSNEVTLFAKLIYESSDLLETIKDAEIRVLTFDNFTDLVIDTNIELFRKLSVSLLPKEDGWKLIDKMEVFFESDENEESFSSEELSEGQKKQLLIKFATKILADENSILLLDEPDSHIHVSNKEKIKDLLYEDIDKPFVQSIITTHSPTLTSTFNNENVFMLKKENKQVQIVDKEQQEIIKELFGEKFSPQVQNMFLASNKPIILLVEGKHDKEHISNAFEKLANEYPDIQFDIFQMNSACNIPPMMLGLRTNEIDYKKLIIGILMMIIQAG